MNFTLPAGYEAIDGNKYPTHALQVAAYDDIRLAGTSGLPGAFLYGKPKQIKSVAYTSTWAQSKLSWPLNKVFITQRFGADPRTYNQMGLKGHDGVDLRTRFWDSPLARRTVMAADDGTCTVQNDGHAGYGLHVRIRHVDGSMTIYGHLSKVSVGTGSFVHRGMAIGVSGNSGFSSAPHLHFEYRPPKADVHNGFAGAVDPLPFLPSIG